MSSNEVDPNAPRATGPSGPEGGLGAPVDRRQFLRLIEGTLAAAGLAGCTLQPPQSSLPYVVQPEHVVPGRPLHYATTMPWCGYGVGVLGECHMGRPTKVEGNPLHPASRGKTNLFMQASVLGLYSPGRTRAITFKGGIRTWAATAQMLEQKLASLPRGAGLAVLTGTVTSPSLAAQLDQLQKRYPEARLYHYDPLDDGSAHAGAEAAFGRPVDAVYDFAAARRIVALASDFLVETPGSVRYAFDFGRSRDVVSAGADMTRLYAVDATPTITSVNADHRRLVPPSVLPALARELTRLVTGAGGLEESAAPHRAWLQAVAADLGRHKGHSLVVAGRGAATEIHALAHLMNASLGNVGRTVHYKDPVGHVTAPHFAALAALTTALAAGKVELLVILGGNPAYTAPSDIPFATALTQAPQTTSLYLGAEPDETATLCQWHVPESHYMECWGDLRAYDGLVSFQQPLIRPLFVSRSPAEMLAAVLGESEPDSHGLLYRYWQARHQAEQSSAGFDELWRQSVHDGFIAGTNAPAVMVTPKADLATRLLARSPLAATTSGTLELVFRPDPTAWDGTYSGNAWLQETPKPLYTLTWDNAALLAPADAEKLQLRNGDIARLALDDAKIEAPVLIVPGQPAGAVTLTLGYGRTPRGDLVVGYGYDAYRLRASHRAWNAAGATILRTGRLYPLALTQEHHRMEGRDLVKTFPYATFRGSPAQVAADLARGTPALDESLLAESPKGNYEWGMAIDLNQCIGCNACITACQAENNIPVVGKSGVARGREMHWIRVDRYFAGTPTHPEVYHQPVPCMHCEKAPCELVSPVEATLHDSEGLNEMVYNRCVGTRYCSNNCPYKVRRFNFFDYSPKSSTVELVHNPDVSVRDRGVMEKCTYCIQRIEAARITAQKDNRRIRDGEIQPACAAACPTEAIVFGNIADKGAKVARFKADPRNYGLLAELNTRPRTTYLARLMNLNPDLQGEA